MPAPARRFALPRRVFMDLRTAPRSKAVEQSHLGLRHCGVFASQSGQIAAISAPNGCDFTCLPLRSRSQKSASRAQRVMLASQTSRTGACSQQFQGFNGNCGAVKIGLRDSAIPLSAAVTAKPLLNAGRIICPSALVTLVVAVALAL